MKNLIIIFVLLSSLAFTQQPTIKFELKSGTNQSYKLDEINKKTVLKKQKGKIKNPNQGIATLFARNETIELC